MISGPSWMLKSTPETALVEGIRALPVLREFYWYGTSPGIPASIVQAIADCPTLTTLRFPP
jgi:hypothetical protein